MLKKFFQEEDGQTLVEYGLLISLIALALVTATVILGTKIKNFYGHVANTYPTPAASLT